MPWLLGQIPNLWDSFVFHWPILEDVSLVGLTPGSAGVTCSFDGLYAFEDAPEMSILTKLCLIASTAKTIYENSPVYFDIAAKAPRLTTRFPQCCGHRPYQFTTHFGVQQYYKCILPILSQCQNLVDNLGEYFVRGPTPPCSMSSRALHSSPYAAPSPSCHVCNAPLSERLRFGAFCNVASSSKRTDHDAPYRRCASSPRTIEWRVCPVCFCQFGRGSTLQQDVEKSRWRVPEGAMRIKTVRIELAVMIHPEDLDVKKLHAMLGHTELLRRMKIFKDEGLDVSVVVCEHWSRLATLPIKERRRTYL
ncbi:hypothetical protein BDZ89DRAFT_1070517 [Hymenopellis radicata]|nr:hypothetical protein BDZ89DRAFT_1070517 [Hymenopellis radicata]